MKLFVTLTSPYSRLVRAVIIEKMLQDRVTVTPIQTRTPDSPLYSINPSGRVPTLVTDDGVIFEDSSLICTYLDHLDGPPCAWKLKCGVCWTVSPCGVGNFTDPSTSVPPPSLIMKPPVPIVS